MRFPILSFIFLATMQFPGSTVLAEDFGLAKGYSSRVVVDGLCNPSSVSFHPDGWLTVCDSGHGRVLVVKGNQREEFATGFETESWKVDADTGTKRFLLGPLSSLWVDDETLAVTNSGLKDGQENVLFFSGAGSVETAKATNSVGPTSDDPADKGEGNLCGMSMSLDGKTLFVAGQGADAKTWILTVDVKTKKLSPKFSADEVGVEINSPMDTMAWDKNSILALYSGAGGKEDGLVIRWDINSGKILSQWKLTGINDPMGFARVGKTNDIVVVDNNWSLTEVLPGKLARVNLDTTDVKVIATKLLGPVSCEFGPDGDLYIAQLGKQFDKELGQVIAISGIK